MEVSLSVRVGSGGQPEGDTVVEGEGRGGVG